MVARPPVKLTIEAMRLEDLDAVHQIELASFSAPWPPNAYRSELETNRLANYLVGRLDGQVIAYGGMWLMADEAHITTFAVHPGWRRRRIGERLLVAFLDLAIGRGAREATLEVRLSNVAARRLYEKYGFRPVGLRPRYYSDDGEDALIMTTEPLSEDGLPRSPRPAPRGARRIARATRTGRGDVSGPLVLAVESSCDETSIAVVEGGRQIHSNVVASQTALHAATGGIVPEVAARAHLRWIVPVLDEALSDAGVTVPEVDAVAVTYGPGLAGSLLVGINFAKTIAFVHEKPLVGVNHLEGHLYAAWLLDPGEAEREEPVFPLVALIVSGGHTFLVEMRDHLTYRLLGQTVDDAAGEAFDKVGRLLGLPYPGGPAIQRAAEGATRRDAAFPRAWLGETYDFSFSGLKSAARRTVDEARAAAGLPVRPAPATPDPVDHLPDATTAELAWGFQDSVVDVLATKTIRAAEEVGARSIVLGGGVAANAALRSRIAGEAEARGLALNVPRPGLCTDNGAMIGAAAARAACGRRSGRARPRRSAIPAAGRS